MDNSEKNINVSTSIFWWMGIMAVMNCALLCINLADAQLGEFADYLYALCCTISVFHFFNLATSRYNARNTTSAKLSGRILPWAWVQSVAFFAIIATLPTGSSVLYSAALWAGLAYNVVLIGIIARKRFC